MEASERHSVRQCGASCPADSVNFRKTRGLLAGCATWPTGRQRWTRDRRASSRPRRRWFTPRSIPYFNLARLFGSWEAVRGAQRRKARAIAAHGPALSAWCALFARVARIKIPIIAHSFNFTTLPRQLKRRAFSVTLSRVDRFVVYSTMERDLYAREFRIPPERFDVVLWGVRSPHVDIPESPLEQGSYVCAIGGNARDYRTLVEVARLLPHIRLYYTGASIGVPRGVSLEFSRSGRRTDGRRTGISRRGFMLGHLWNA